VALLATLPLDASASEAAEVQLAERVTVGTSDLVLAVTLPGDGSRFGRRRASGRVRNGRRNV